MMLLPILNKCLWGVVGKSFPVIVYCYEPFNSLPFNSLLKAKLAL